MTLIGVLVRKIHAFMNIKIPLHEVFGSLQNTGFALVQEKSTLRAIDLWHLEFSQGINLLPVGIQVIHRIPQPANLWTVCWIVEMGSFYPKFIHDVSMNAARLNRLLKGKFFFSPRLRNEYQLPIVPVQTPVWEISVLWVVSNKLRETPIST